MTSRKAVSNDWLFSRNVELQVDMYANSTATFVSEEAERMVVEQYRNRRHRPPVTEWSDYADPWEPAGLEDWSPVRSVRLSTPAVPKPVSLEKEQYREFASRRTARRKWRKAALRDLVEPAPKPIRRGPKIKDIPAILDDLHALMDGRTEACS